MLKLSTETREEKIAGIEHHFKEIIALLGLDPESSSLAKTPHRIAAMYVDDIFSGLDPATFPEISFTEDAKTAAQQEMIVTQSSFTSFCEHHFLPMVGQAFVAYIPQKKIIGLSKIPRLIRFFAARPQLQERLTVDIAQGLSALLETDHVAVALHAQHCCVIARGIRDEQGMTMTTTLLVCSLRTRTKNKHFIRPLTMKKTEKKGTFEISCLHCKQPVPFEVSELEEEPQLIIECPDCKKKYAIGDETLKRQLLQFGKLCREIRASEEILGSASVAVDVGPHSVKIPFKILLTRLKSTLELKIGSDRATIVFRTEPCAPAVLPMK